MAALKLTTGGVHYKILMPLNGCRFLPAVKLKIWVPPQKSGGRLKYKSISEEYPNND